MLIAIPYFPVMHQSHRPCDSSQRVFMSMTDICVTTPAAESFTPVLPPLLPVYEVGGGHSITPMLESQKPRKSSGRSVFDCTPKPRVQPLGCFPVESDVLLEMTMW